MNQVADRKSRVLVTGGAGLVGRTLVPLLRDQYVVTHLECTDPGDGLPWVQADLRDAAAVTAACAGVTAILHIAALHGHAWQQAGDDTAFAVNVLGTQNILAAAVRQQVRRVVFTSSIWATGHGGAVPDLPLDEALPREPVELYGLTKILGEQMCRYYSARHELSTIVLRPGGIQPAEKYAPHDPSYLFGTADVRDVAQAHRLALELPATVRHEVFIITADSPLARVSAAEYQADPAAALARVCPQAGPVQLPATAEWYTIAKARRDLGYQPCYNFQPW